MVQSVKIEKRVDIGYSLTRLGYRLMSQRLMVLEAIEQADSHISVEEIYGQIRARYPHVSISTVYHTLELLKERGLVAETDMGDGRVRYLCAGRGRHHHLVCQRCGEIIDMEESMLNSGASRKNFFWF